MSTQRYTGTAKLSWNDGVNEWIRLPRLEIRKSCNNITSHWLKDIGMKSVITVWASVIALKFTRTKLVVQCIYSTAVIGYEEPVFIKFKDACFYETDLN